MRLIRFFAAAVAVAAANVAPLAAQNTDAAKVDPRWHAWLGCWKMDRTTPGVASERCVLPTSDPSSVEITSYADGKAVDHEVLSFAASPTPREQGGCSTVTRASWGSDALHDRVYVTEERSCPNGRVAKSSGVLAISKDGEMVDVRTFRAEKTTTLRTLRYQPMTVAPEPATDGAAQLANLRDAIAAARLAAMGPMEIADVVDVSKHVDSSATEAWLLLGRYEIPVEKSTLIAMADANLPTGVIDIVVALSRPDVFVVNPESGAAAYTQPQRGPRGTRYGARPVYGMYGAYGAPMFAYSPYGWYDFYSPYSNYGYGGGYGSAYGMYGYSGYGYGLSPYGYYGGYGYGLGYGYGYSPVRGPIILVNDGNNNPGGSAVKGRGYTAGVNAGSGRTSSPKPAGAASGGSSTSGGTRTAKPRPR